MLEELKQEELIKKEKKNNALFVAVNPPHQN